jgi:hypothetical protein
MSKEAKIFGLSVLSWTSYGLLGALPIAFRDRLDGDQPGWQVLRVVLAGILIGTLFGAIFYPFAWTFLWRRRLDRVRLRLFVTMTIAGPVLSVVGGAYYAIGGPLVFLTTCAVLWRILPLYYETPGHCHTCDYDLTGNVSGVCPECGTVISDDLSSSAGHLQSTADHQ